MVFFGIGVHLYPSNHAGRLSAGGNLKYQQEEDPILSSCLIGAIYFPCFYPRVVFDRCQEEYFSKEQKGLNFLFPLNPLKKVIFSSSYLSYFSFSSSLVFNNRAGDAYAASYASIS